jgi:DNA-binding NarL/FixJ family response regulator
MNTAERRPVADHDENISLVLGARVERATAKWRLTPRRAEVLRCLLEGDANKTIGDKLGIAERTVEVHVTELLRNTRTESRARLVAAVWKMA